MSFVEDVYEHLEVGEFLPIKAYKALDPLVVDLEFTYEKDRSGGIKVWTGADERVFATIPPEWLNDGGRQWLRVYRLMSSEYERGIEQGKFVQVQSINRGLGW